MKPLPRQGKLGRKGSAGMLLCKKKHFVSSESLLRKAHLKKIIIAGEKKKALA
jgi:hypothetical protein